MHIYSRNGEVPVILSCTDHMFLDLVFVFEHTHSSDTATRYAATRFFELTNKCQCAIC